VSFHVAAAAAAAVCVSLMMSLYQYEGVSVRQHSENKTYERVYGKRVARVVRVDLEFSHTTIRTQRPSSLE
jgi:hypothetical protein